VLVDVVAVLEVAVTVVEMIDVVVVDDSPAIVIVGVRGLVAAVDLRLRMTFAVVNVIDVIAVHDGFVAVSRQVFVIAGFGVLFRCHGFLRCRVRLKLSIIEIIVNKARGSQGRSPACFVPVDRGAQ
jgi:hypothetical protein